MINYKLQFDEEQNILIASNVVYNFFKTRIMLVNACNHYPRFYISYS